MQTTFGIVDKTDMKRCYSRTKVINPVADRKPDTYASLSREIGSCVYYIRCTDGLIKIGHTTDLADRKRAFGKGWQHVLAVTPGSFEEEHAMHVRFRPALARGREYFRPVQDLLAHINEIRGRLGVPPLPIAEGCAE